MPNCFTLLPLHILKIIYSDTPLQLLKIIDRKFEMLQVEVEVEVAIAKLKVETFQCDVMGLNSMKTHLIILYIMTMNQYAN